MTVHRVAFADKVQVEKCMRLCLVVPSSWPEAMVGGQRSRWAATPPSYRQIMHSQDLFFSGLDGDMGRNVRRVLGAVILVVLVFGAFHVTWGFHVVWGLMMWRTHEQFDPLIRNFGAWMIHPLRTVPLHPR